MKIQDEELNEIIRKNSITNLFKTSDSMEQDSLDKVTLQFTITLLMKVSKQFVFDSLYIGITAIIINFVNQFSLWLKMTKVL